MTDLERAVFTVITQFHPHANYEQVLGVTEEINEAFIHYLRKRSADVGSIELTDQSNDRVVEMVERWIRVIQHQDEIAPLAGRQLAAGVLLAVSNDLAVGDDE